MMTSDTFLGSLPVVLGVMALLSVLETVLPFVRSRALRRRHALPNLTLTTLTVGLNFAGNAAAVLALAACPAGLLPGVRIPRLVMIPTAILVLDASAYAAHRLLHAVPRLWRAHRVHHSDPLVDVTTALRFHPVETVWRFLFVVVPAWTLGLSVEAVAVYRVLSVVVALVEHANVALWQPLDGVLSLALCTPNLHKVHHSRLAIQANTNYGNIFSLFDRICGTFTPSAVAHTVAYGLASHDDPATQRLGALLGLRVPGRAPLGRVPLT